MGKNQWRSSCRTSRTTLSFVGSIPWWTTSSISIRYVMNMLGLIKDGARGTTATWSRVIGVSAGHVHARLHLCWCRLRAARDVGHRRPLPLGGRRRVRPRIPGRLRLLVPVVVFGLRLLHLEHDGGLLLSASRLRIAGDAGSVARLKPRRARSLAPSLALV